MELQQQGSTGLLGKVFAVILSLILFIIAGGIIAVLGLAGGMDGSDEAMRMTTTWSLVVFVGAVLLSAGVLYLAKFNWQKIVLWIMADIVVIVLVIYLTLRFDLPVLISPFQWL